MIDPVELTRALVRCPSVTPDEAGALALLEDELAPLGFRCTRIRRGRVENLYARIGTVGPVLGFAGHTDVVPAGDRNDWTADPFGGELVDGAVIGRGAVDMKSGVAAFAAACSVFVTEHDAERGSIALLITGDEEGDAIDGTAAILDWMAEAGETLDFCIVGEPTSLARVGDTVKIGRRGSMNARLVVTGRAGHTAYPDAALNPLPGLARICARLAATPLDTGSTHFEASTLALTSIDCANPASNVIPQAARAAFNVRFNDLHSSEEIKVWVEQIVAAEIDDTGLDAEIEWTVSGESFLTEPAGIAEVVLDAVTERTLERPALSTGGGTSDARFVKEICPVVELGLVGEGMHAADERVPADDIRELSALYLDILRRFFVQ